MTKLLITGASGFLGKPIVRELAALGEYNIYAVTSGRREVMFPDGINVLSADLLDKEQSGRLIEDIKPDIMVHFAWDLAGSGYQNSDSNKLWLDESLFMLHTFINSGGKYFVFAGSRAEYGSFHGFREDGSTGDVSIYGQCKNSFHSAAIKLCEENGVDYTCLRIFTTLGCGMTPGLTAVSAAVAAFTAGERFECKAPYNVWDFISVNDVARAVCTIIKKQYSGIVNIGSGIPYMMSDIFTKIAEKMNCEQLLSIDYYNKESDIIVADTDVLNNTIGYICKDEIDKIIDDIINEALGGSN